MTLRVWQQITIMVCLPVAFLIAELVALGALFLHTQSVSESFVRSKSELLRYQVETNSIFSLLLKISSLAIPSAPQIDFKAVAAEFSRNRPDLRPQNDLRPEITYAVRDTTVFDDVQRLLNKAEAVSHNPQIAPRARFSAINYELSTVLMELHTLSDRMIEADAKLKLAAPAELNKLRMWIITGTVVSTLLTAMTSLLMSSAFLRNIRSRLQVVADNAAAIAIRKDLSPPLSGNDELSELDSVLHRTAALISDKQIRELAILNKAVDVLCSFDRQLRFAAVGASTSSAWHFSPDDLLGRSLLTLMPESEASKTSSALEKLQAGSECDFETQVNCGDGQVKEFHWKINKNENGTYYGVARDITEKRVVTRARQRLIAVAGHDIRTPLSSISSAIALLQSGVYGQLAPGTANALRRADANLERLMDLIRDLLELEKLESGKFTLQLQCVSALDACLSAIHSIAPLAESEKIKVVPPNRDDSILADERRLVQILLNLISQALKNTRAGGRLNISTTVAGKFLRFAVTSAAAIDRSSDPAVTGGLAIAISRTLVLAHGGELAVESTINGDLHFYFTVPLFQISDDSGAEYK